MGDSYKPVPKFRTQADHDSQVPGWTGKPTEAEVDEAFVEYKVEDRTLYRCKGCNLDPFKSKDFRKYHYLLCKDLDPSYKCGICKNEYLTKCTIDSHVKHRLRLTMQKKDKPVWKRKNQKDQIIKKFLSRNRNATE